MRKLSTGRGKAFQQMIIEVGRHRSREIELSQIVMSLEVGQWRLIKSFEQVCHKIEAVFVEVLPVVSRME